MYKQLMYIRATLG